MVTVVASGLPKKQTPNKDLNVSSLFGRRAKKAGNGRGVSQGRETRARWRENKHGRRIPPATLLSLSLIGN